jgi:hypothetical protein
MEITKRIAIIRPRGDGLRRLCAQSLTAAILASTIIPKGFVVIFVAVEAESILNERFGWPFEKAIASFLDPCNEHSSASSEHS